jgi:hypothetical protein
MPRRRLAPSVERMPSHQSQPAIDLDPPAGPHPTLALVLALLAVPGSTVAWDLPLGGLWIGLPLALAAIVLGWRARREQVGKGRATAGMLLAGLCIAQMAVWSVLSVTDASGQPAPASTLTFRELDRGATFSHIRNTKGPRQSNQQGDLFASVSPLADVSGSRIGKLHLDCVTTSGARNFLNSEMTCTAIATLRDGTVTAQFVDELDRTTHGAITGGTGAYANATGVFVSRRTKSGAVDTLTFGE